jgi:hypothetical protein
MALGALPEIVGALLTGVGVVGTAGVGVVVAAALLGAAESPPPPPQPLNATAPNASNSTPNEEECLARIIATTPERRSLSVAMR